ncbi:MAG: hypothetical protein F6K39_19665 [Okeania sp. SIO3B3]|nr:hypothetical protein [Okeania sp. SIO3B3]
MFQLDKVGNIAEERRGGATPRPRQMQAVRYHGARQTQGNADQERKKEKSSVV